MYINRVAEHGQGDIPHRPEGDSAQDSNDGVDQFIEPRPDTVDRQDDATVYDTQHADVGTVALTGLYIEREPQSHPTGQMLPQDSSDDDREDAGRDSEPTGGPEPLPDEGQADEDTVPAAGDGGRKEPPKDGTSTAEFPEDDDNSRKGDPDQGKDVDEDGDVEGREQPMPREERVEAETEVKGESNDTSLADEGKTDTVDSDDDPALEGDKIGETAPPGSELAQFLDAYRAELAQRASDITETASWEGEAIEPDAVVQTTRFSMVAIAEASLDLEHDEAEVDEQAVINRGLQLYAQIAAAKRADIHLFIKDKIGTQMLVALDPSDEEQEEMAELIAEAPESMLLLFFNSFSTDLQDRANKVTQLAELAGQSEGFIVASRDIGLSADTKAALEMEEYASGLTNSDIANRGACVYTYFASAQRAGIRIYFEDDSGAQETIPGLNPLPGT